MLHAAATFIGLFIVSLVLVEPLAGRDAIAAAAAIAALATAIALRLGGAPASFTQALLGARRAWRGFSRVIAGALKTIRTAAAADVSMRPALIRVANARGTTRQRGRVAHGLGAAPGAMVVDVDEGGLLVHVTHEDDAGAADLERMVRDLGGGRA